MGRSFLTIRKTCWSELHLGWRYGNARRRFWYLGYCFIGCNSVGLSDHGWIVQQLSTSICRDVLYSFILDWSYDNFGIDRQYHQHIYNFRYDHVDWISC